jgi:Cof subfamily protein (haloacid dehalogenase superfamily)
MAYKIVFFDIDGTLVDENGRIPPGTLESIHKLKALGIKVWVASGRSPYHLRFAAEALGVDSFIGFNGSMVVHQGELIHEQFISPASLELLNQAAVKRNHPLVYYGGQTYCSSHHDHPDIVGTFRSLKIDPPVHNPSLWKESKIYQAMLYCRDAEELEYTVRLSDIRFVRWHEFSVDVIPSTGSKAKGIEIVLKHLGLLPEEAVAFGDALNDREMLSYVGMGIAMGNAHEGLRPYADFITKPVDEGGITYGLQQIGLIQA